MKDGEYGWIMNVVWMRMDEYVWRMDEYEWMMNEYG